MKYNQKNQDDVAEKPEGESTESLLKKLDDFTRGWNSGYNDGYKNAKAEKPEAEPVESAEEILKRVFLKHGYKGERHSLKDAEIEAMEEYASLRVAQALKK